jgi:acetyl esterase/lipase
VTPTLPRPVVERLVRATVRPWVSRPPRIKRPALDLLSRVAPRPRGIRVERQARGDVPGYLVSPDTGLRAARILYLHGGGYESGSPATTHAAVIAALARGASAGVFAPRYRLSPEHPAPAALEDARVTYEAMLADGEAPVVAGDSAGGGLALALAVTLRDEGTALPPCLALMSPWVDLTLSGVSLRANARRDALLTRAFLEGASARYSAGLGKEDPVCSPIRADLGGLPPMVIHAGRKEMLLSDAEELARRVEAARGAVELTVFEDLWHDFHVHAGMLREADEAVAAIGARIAAHLDGG